MCIRDRGDAACNEFAGGFAGGHVDELDGGCDGVRPEDEPVGEEVGIAKREAAAVADCEQGRTVGAIGVERVVVAIDEGNGLRENEGVHRNGIGGGDADSDEALPGAARVGGAGTNGLEQPGGQMNPALRGGSSNVWLEQCGMVRNERNGVSLALEGHGEGRVVRGQKVDSGQVLGGKHPVDGLK